MNAPANRRLSHASSTHAARLAAALLSAVAACGLAAPARAAPEEIQVYQDEIDAAGTLGLDIHMNDVFGVSSAADYPGAERALHRVRITPEFSLGLGGGFEVGLYLPLATIAADGHLRAQGVKTRLKWVAPHDPARGFYYGANVEIGRVAYALDQNPWNAEFKAIGGWHGGRWALAANANIDFTVSGPAPSPATIELATKASYALSPGLAVGIESFNGLGSFAHPGQLAREEHATFLTAATHIGRWDFDWGLGEGYGTNGDHLTGRVIISVPI